MKNQKKASNLKKNKKEPKKEGGRTKKDSNLCFANNKEVRQEYRD